MGSLSLLASSRINASICRNPRNLGYPSEYRQIRQRGFPFFRRKWFKIGSLYVQRRSGVRRKCGLQCSQDGSSMVEDEEKIVPGSNEDGPFSSPVMLEPKFESGLDTVENEVDSLHGGTPKNGPTKLKEDGANEKGHTEKQDSESDEVVEKITRVLRSIVFVTSEAAPYSKTGGLGDVCGSLPIALAGHGHRVMVVSPRYLHGTPADKIYAGALDADCRIKVHCFGGEQEVAFFHEYRAGVDWVFVDHPAFHRPGNPYGDSFGAFGDNQFRFALLCHAACEAPLVLPLGGFTYGEKCLFLANDWHAGLVPV